jgi:protein transport protein SEC61 subunit gamma-like protein
MSDVNAVIVQPFKQFVKASRAASKNEHCRRDAPAASRPPRHHTTAPLPPSRGALRKTHAAPSPRHRRARRVAPAPPPHYCATHTPPPRRRRRRDADTSPTQDSIHLVKKCTKPDRKEFARIASATMIGFLIMGFVGFFVKLVHIPINNILMT